MAFWNSHHAFLSIIIPANLQIPKKEDVKDHTESSYQRKLNITTGEEEKMFFIVKVVHTRIKFAGM